MPHTYAGDGGISRTMGVKVVSRQSCMTTPTIRLAVQDLTYWTPNSAVPDPVSPTLAVPAPGTLQKPAQVRVSLSTRRSPPPGCLPPTRKC